jgi:hypothetical protein
LGASIQRSPLPETENTTKEAAGDKETVEKRFVHRWDLFNGVTAGQEYDEHTGGGRLVGERERERERGFSVGGNFGESFRFQLVLVFFFFLSKK